jgi:hypothetical protein
MCYITNACGKVTRTFAVQQSGQGCPLSAVVNIRRRNRILKGTGPVRAYADDENVSEDKSARHQVRSTASKGK